MKELPRILIASIHSNKDKFIYSNGYYAVINSSRKTELEKGKLGSKANIIRDGLGIC